MCAFFLLLLNLRDENTHPYSIDETVTARFSFLTYNSVFHRSKARRERILGNFHSIIKVPHDKQKDRFAY
jgi:hypothetical protein